MMTHGAGGGAGLSRRLAAPALAAMLLAGGTVPAAAATDSGRPQARAKPFSAYVSCGAKGRHADRYCFEGDHPVAVFTAHQRAQVPYRVCFRKRGERQRCKERGTRRRDKASRTTFDIDGSGRYQLAFFAAGRAVDRDSFVVRERSVFVIGDSLAEGTRPYMPRALDGWRVSQSVSISRHAPEGVAILRRRDNLPSVAVMSLGTNDDPRAVGTFRSAVRSTLSIMGGTRCVVWPNIVRPPVGGASYAGYNRVLADADRSNRNFQLVNWARMVKRNRHWLADDGVHVSAEGYQARARAIAKQVERC